MTKFLAGLNEGIYEILIWLILLPKTLIKIVLHPKWIVPFINTELNKDPSEQHEEYAPPVVFFVIFGVMPGTGFLMAFSNKLGDFGKAFSSLSIDSQVFCIIVFLASFPLAAAVVIQWFLKAPISRTNLRPSLYSQFYCWGAMYLACYFAVPVFLEPDSNPATSIDLDVSTYLFLVPSIYLYWFAYSEICIIRAQLETGIAKAIGVLVVIYFAGLFLMLAVEMILLFSIFSVVQSQTSPVLPGISP